MEKNNSASSGKVPLLVSIQPTKSEQERAEQLLQTAKDLLNQLGVTATGGEIVGVYLEKITPVGAGLRLTMIINTLIPELDTISRRPNSVERWD